MTIGRGSSAKLKKNITGKILPYVRPNKSCKEMGGATSVMPVIRDAFSQQIADTTQWADVSWPVRCDWLQVAS